MPHAITFVDLATGQSYDVTLDDATWMDERAAAIAMGITVQQLITDALDSFCDRPDVQLQIPERD